MKTDWKRTARGLLALAQRGGTEAEAQNAAKAFAQFCAENGVLDEVSTSRAKPKMIGSGRGPGSATKRLDAFYDGLAPSWVDRYGKTVTWGADSWKAAQKFHAMRRAGCRWDMSAQNWIPKESHEPFASVRQLPPAPVGPLVAHEPRVAPVLTLVSGCSHCGEPLDARAKDGWCGPCAAIRPAPVATASAPVATALATRIKGSCSASGCSSSTHARGLCAPHYRQARQTA